MLPLDTKGNILYIFSLQIGIQLQYHAIPHIQNFISQGIKGAVSGNYNRYNVLKTYKKTIQQLGTFMTQVSQKQ